MYKTVFQNSKAALAFAGMTILGAVMMVGSPDDQGVINKAVDRLSKEREAIADNAREFAEVQSVGDTVTGSDAGWGSSTPVFGEFGAIDPANELGPAVIPASRHANKSGAAGFIPGPQPVIADNDGIPVPRLDGRQASPPPVAVITSREMTIEPQ